MVLPVFLTLLVLTSQLTFFRSTPTATYTPPGSYAAAVLADGPSAFWPLDEPARSTVAGDLTGNGHYGTISSGVTAGVAGPPTGDGDTAMAFHGADAITVANMAGLPSGSHPYTLEAWVDLARGGAASKGLVGYGNYGADGQVDALRTNGSAGPGDYELAYKEAGERADQYAPNGGTCCHLRAHPAPVVPAGPMPHCPPPTEWSDAGTAIRHRRGIRR